MREISFLVGSGRRFAVLLLLLVLGAAALPAVQAQGTSMYVLLWKYNNWTFKVDRISLGAAYDGGVNYSLCFSGSATLGTDFYVRDNDGRKTPSGNCINDTFGSGERGIFYYIMPLEDGVADGVETANLTMSISQSGYYLASNSASFRVSDD